MGCEVFEVTGEDFGPAVHFGRRDSSLEDAQPIEVLAD